MNVVYDPVLPSEAFVDKHDQKFGGHIERILISLNEPSNYVAIVDLLTNGVPVLYFALKQSATEQFNMVLELSTKGYQYVIQHAIDIIRWAFNTIKKNNESSQGQC